MRVTTVKKTFSVVSPVVCNSLPGTVQRMPKNSAFRRVCSIILFGRMETATTDLVVFFYPVRCYYFVDRLHLIGGLLNCFLCSQLC